MSLMIPAVCFCSAGRLHLFVCCRCLVKIVYTKHEATLSIASDEGFVIVTLRIILKT